MRGTARIKAFVVLFGALSCALGGCTTAGNVSPSADDVARAKPDRYVSADWLTSYRAEAESRIVDYIQSRYPVIPPDVRAPSIASVVVTNEVAPSFRPTVKQVEEGLDSMLRSVIARVVGTRPRSTVVLDVRATFLTPTLSQGEATAATAAMVPLGAVCFGSLLLLCPGKMSNYVALEADVKRNGAVVATLKGAGGASRVVSSVIVDDSADARTNGMLEANSKAMAAAIADLGAKLVPYLREP